MKQRTLQQIVKQVICLCMVSIVLAPILLTLFAAFKTKADMVNTSPLLLPPFSRVTMDNFQKVLGDKYLLIGFKNTGIILICSIFSTYCLVRLRRLFLNGFNSGSKI